MLQDVQIGLVGGRGMLGRAIALGLLRAGVPASAITIQSRSSAPLTHGLEGMHLVQDSGALSERCDLAFLVVPPADAMKVKLDMAGKPVISVMAGVDMAQLCSIAPDAWAVRAMSSPAAAEGLAFSPWVAAAEMPANVAGLVAEVLGAIGAQARLPQEELLPFFTALTGPVPGFVALFAQMAGDYLIERGVAADVATQAMRQLFLASGQMLAQGPEAQEHVREMLAYGGTTAAGLQVMQNGALRAEIYRGLDAAAAKAREIGQK